MAINDYWPPKTYDVVVSDSTNSYYPTTTSITWGGTTCSICFHFPCTCSTTFFNTWTYPSTVYMYQLKCPQCKKMNWGALNQEISCKGCKSTLKAVSKRVDYEIAVED